MNIGIKYEKQKYSIRKEDFGIIKNLLSYIKNLGFKKTKDGYILEKFILDTDNFNNLVLYKDEGTGETLIIGDTNFTLNMRLQLGFKDFSKYYSDLMPSLILEELLIDFKKDIEEHLKYIIRKNKIKKIIDG